MIVAVFGILRFSPDTVPKILPHLKKLIRETRELDGCLAYDVAQDIFEPGLMRFSELWPDGETLARHLLAPHIAPWREACKLHGLLERKFTAYDADGSRTL